MWEEKLNKEPESDDLGNIQSIQIVKHAKVFTIAVAHKIAITEAVEGKLQV